MSMASFHYRAVSAAGEIVEGDMDASTGDAVVESLRKQGHFPLSVGNESAAAPVPAASSLPVLRLSRHRAPSLGGLAATTRDLATLVRAGVPLDRGLRFATEMTSEKALRQALERILAGVQSGAPLADAVQEHGGGFPGYYSGMLRAGEAGGSLHQVMDQLAGYLDRLHTLRESLRSALIYPAILAVMVVLVIIVMFVGVLPQFRPLFDQLGDDLPLLTRAFLAMGDFLEVWWWAILLALLAAILLFRYRLRDPLFRRAWDRAKLRAPVVGSIIARVETARFLLAGGLPLTEGLRIVRDAMTNTVFRESVEAVGNGVREGGSMANGVADAGVFPNLAVQLIQVGEESGRLDGVLAELANSLERDSQRSIQRLLALLVPVVTLVLGAIVALVIISVLGAFLSVNDLAY
jgi:general secretion pathway protein F